MRLSDSRVSTNLRDSKLQLKENLELSNKQVAIVVNPKALMLITEILGIIRGNPLEINLKVNYY